MGKRIPRAFFVIAAAVVCCFFLLPSLVGAVSGEGNAICSEPGMCKYGTRCGGKNGPPGVIGKPCQESANGKTCTGACVAPGNCKASGCEGLTGEMKGLMDAMKLFQELFKKKEGGGGGGGGAPPTTPAQTYPPCVKNEATGTVSPTPCMETNGMINYGNTTSLDLGSITSGSAADSSIADTLLKALGGTVSTSDDTDTTTTQTTPKTTQSTTAATTTAKIIITPGGAVVLNPSLQGDIQVGPSGGTIFARSRDPNSNTEVAGFFGGSTFNANASQSLIGRLCASRPWAGGVLGAVIPASFFDGLCMRGGYQIGVVQVQPNTSTGVKKAVITTTPSTSQQTQTTVQTTIEPEVDIWAEPASVRLGTRTYIFWTSKAVTSCEETGPSFSQKSLSGGASTVPLSGSSTFKIVCKTESGETIEDTVTVNLAL